MRALFFLFLVLLTVPTLTAPLLASETHDRQIQLIGRQSSLGHRLVRSLCFAQAGIDKERNLRALEESRAEIQNALQILLEGDAATGIPPIKKSNIRTQIGSVELVWNALDQKTAAFLSGAPLSDDEVLKLTFKAQSLEKLWRNVTQSLELMISVEDTPAQLERARLVATASDQSRLLQQAGKDACLMHLSKDTTQSESMLRNLEEALATFNRNIFELTFVRPAVVDAPAQPASLEQAAFDIWQTWVGLDALFSGVMSPSDTENLDALLPEISFTVEFLDTQLRDTLDIFMAL